MARMALRKSIQTVHFVQEWHTDADVLWNTQQKIDGKLASQVAYLKQSIILLGDQLVSLQKQVRLRCDWNYSSFCVTKKKTQLKWDKVKQHLLNQGNISVYIQDLQQDILKVFNKHLNVISGSDFLDTVADNLSSLHPLKQIKTFGYGIALVMGVLLIMCLCFCIVWKRTMKRQRSQQQQLAFLTISHHMQSQKRGDRVFN
ncbi:hypothetical protein FD754_025232 [Muntiacus muntjak]|uniref:Retroviral envelope protein GP41-like domain-containing protein n=1 Tax=Muntiacus muntjak TaxID=9888 RepID=A0A5N3ULB3_MUNMU|nr:hypothetical protein FD754_025233 [Muntiacus muntjak]KAB0337359.1 hypothetical protein FD754_025232 [Muntiacus muntjak]